MTLGIRVQSRIANPLFAGSFSDAEAEARGCRLVTTTHGADGSPQHIILALLVDNTHIVRDARWQSDTDDIFKAAYDVMAELTVGRNLDQLTEITPRLVDVKLREPGGNSVLDLTNDADKPYYVLLKAAERNKPSVAQAQTSTVHALPWSEVGLFEKVRRIESVLDQHVRPALANDGGGLDLTDLNGDELMVQYQGACGSCSSSVGGTLQFIQDSLNNHLNTTLTVKVTGIDEGMFT